MTNAEYPTPRYQAMLPFPWRGFGTAADVVHDQLDIAIFGDLEALYLQASAEARRLEERVEILTR